MEYLAAWLILGLIGALRHHKQSSAGMAVLIVCFGPVALLVEFFIWMIHLNDTMNYLTCRNCGYTVEEGEDTGHNCEAHKAFMRAKGYDPETLERVPHNGEVK